MRKIYRLFIDCVDGETSYSMSSPNLVRLWELLQQHDHEGSSLRLEEHVLLGGGSEGSYMNKETDDSGHVSAILQKGEW